MFQEVTVRFSQGNLGQKLVNYFLGEYTSEDQGNFRTLVTFESRGIEPTEFTPGNGWIVKVEESGSVFDCVNLTEKEWVEYDEKSQQSVGIYDFESRFVSVR